MMRLGLAGAGGALAARQGIGSAAADQSLNVQGGDSGLSPINVPWSAEMPQIRPSSDKSQPAPLTLKKPLSGLNPAPTGLTWTHGATNYVPHQYFAEYPPVNFYELVVKEAPHNFSPGTPGWGASTIWGFDGVFPGPLFRERYGVPTLVRFRNQLASLAVPQEFGITNISTHLHNGHTPSESDGNPLDFFPSEATQADPNARILNRGTGPSCPGFKDQHYPNVYAGFSKIKKNSGPGSSAVADGDPNEGLGSLWYHDHSVGFTAANVYHGMAGFYHLFDDIDTGDETTGLQLPSGDYDVPIMVLDLTFGPDHQPVFDTSNTDGLLGDKFTANGIIQPNCTVDRRRYRLRLLNIGPSRWYEYWLTDGTNFIAKPFWRVTSDGNLLPKALQVDSVRLAVAERADVIVDFAKLYAKYGNKPLYLVNRLEQKNGRGPTGKLLSVAESAPIIRFQIGSLPGTPDRSVDFSAPGAKLALRNLPAIPQDLSKLTRRSFTLERGNGAWQINGKFFEFDANFDSPTDDLIPEGSAEIWTVKNGGGGWAHPAHIHFEEHQIITVNGSPVPDDSPLKSRKDVAALAPGDELVIYIQLRDMIGRYPQHCHNVVHEDHAMMKMWEIVAPTTTSASTAKKGSST